MKPNYLTVLLLLFSFISLSLISTVSAKSNPVIYIYVTPGVSFYAGANATISCGQYLGDAGANLKLYRDIYEVANGTATSYPPVAEYAHLLPGHYIYTCIYVESANYNTYAVYQEVTSVGLEQAVTVTILPTSEVIYGTQTTAGCVRYSGYADSILALYRNNTFIASGTTSSYPPAQETKVLDAGGYHYRCDASGSEIYMNASSPLTAGNLKVNKKMPSISISMSPSGIICENNSITVSCSRIDGNLTEPLTLYRDGEVVATGITSPQSEITVLNPTGIYNYTCAVAGSSNWYGATESTFIGNGSYLINSNISSVDNVLVMNGDPYSNFATSNYLEYGHDTVGAIRSYIKFDLSPFPFNSVTAATLQLYQSGYLEAPAGFVVYEVLDDGVNDGWQQDTITYDNQPCGSGQTTFNASCNSTHSTDIKDLTAESYVNISVTEFANRAFKRSSKSFTLVITNLTQEGLSGDNRNLFTSSRNGSTYAPVLYLEINGSCASNIIIPQNITAETFTNKFMTLMVSSQGAVLIIITFLSAIIAKIFNEELSLYITSALIFICGILTFFPLWIGLTGSIFGAIVAIMLGKKGVSD